MDCYQKVPALQTGKDGDTIEKGLLSDLVTFFLLSSPVTLDVICQLIDVPVMKKVSLILSADKSDRKITRHLFRSVHGAICIKTNLKCSECVWKINVWTNRPVIQKLNTMSQPDLSSNYSIFIGNYRCFAPQVIRSQAPSILVVVLGA